MKSICRWVVKNQKLPMTLILIFILLSFTVVLFSLYAPLWVIYAVIVLVTLFFIFFLQFCNNKLMKEPVKQLNDFCDPVPILEETERFLNYNIPEADKQIHTINYCVALRDMGEYEKAYETLSSLNIDKTLMLLPATKVVYYNNLSDLCDVLGYKERADIWCDKEVQIYSDMRESKIRKSLKNVVLSSQANKVLRAGEYEEAIRQFEEIVPDCKHMEVNNSLACAKAYLALGDINKAKENLRFVVENGNELYAVTEAEALLSKI